MLGVGEGTRTVIILTLADGEERMAAPRFIRHLPVERMRLRIADLLTVPVPDQFAILIEFPDAMKGNLAYCTVGPSELEEKMVARNELDILQWNLDDFPAYAIMVTNHEIAGRKRVIPPDPVK
jgi:hypothetical protein